MGVETLDQVSRPWDSPLMHVAGEEWQSPLNIRQHTHTADITPVVIHELSCHMGKLLPAPSFGKEFLDLPHERKIRGVGWDPEGHPDILLVMIVTELDDAVRVYLPSGLVDVLVVITDDGCQGIQEEFQGLEEGKTRGVVLCHREDIRRDIVREVVNAVEHRDLP